MHISNFLLIISIWKSYYTCPKLNSLDALSTSALICFPYSSKSIAVPQTHLAAILYAFLLQRTSPIKTLKDS
jgi:hypothetical protein